MSSQPPPRHSARADDSRYRLTYSDPAGEQAIRKLLNGGGPYQITAENGFRIFVNRDSLDYMLLGMKARASRTGKLWLDPIPAQEKNNPNERNIMSHPSQKISHLHSGHLLSDLLNVTEALNLAVILAGGADSPSEQELAELVWFAGRAHSEAIAALAIKLGVDHYEIREAMEDPDEHPELAARLNSLVDGLVEVI